MLAKFLEREERHLEEIVYSTCTTVTAGIPSGSTRAQDPAQQGSAPHSLLSVPRWNNHPSGNVPFRSRVTENPERVFKAGVSLTHTAPRPNHPRLLSEEAPAISGSPSPGGKGTGQGTGGGEGLFELESATVSANVNFKLQRARKRQGGTRQRFAITPPSASNTTHPKFNNARVQNLSLNPFSFLKSCHLAHARCF